MITQDMHLPMKEMAAHTGILRNTMEANMVKTKISII
jgi:hypothetical protein